MFYPNFFGASTTQYPPETSSLSSGLSSTHFYQNALYELSQLSGPAPGRELALMQLQTQRLTSREIEISGMSSLLQYKMPSPSLSLQYRIGETQRSTTSASAFYGTSAAFGLGLGAGLSATPSFPMAYADMMTDVNRRPPPPLYVASKVSQMSDPFSNSLTSSAVAAAAKVDPFASPLQRYQHHQVHPSAKCSGPCCSTVPGLPSVQHFNPHHHRSPHHLNSVRGPLSLITDSCACCPPPPPCVPTPHPASMLLTPALPIAKDLTNTITPERYSKHQVSDSKKPFSHEKQASTSKQHQTSSPTTSTASLSNTRSGPIPHQFWNPSIGITHHPSLPPILPPPPPLALPLPPTTITSVVNTETISCAPSSQLKPSPAAQVAIVTPTATPKIITAAAVIPEKSTSVSDKRVQPLSGIKSPLPTVNSSSNAISFAKMKSEARESRETTTAAQNVATTTTITLTTNSGSSSLSKTGQSTLISGVSGATNALTNYAFAYQPKACEVITIDETDTSKLQRSFKKENCNTTDVNDNSYDRSAPVLSETDKCATGITSDEEKTLNNSEPQRLNVVAAAKPTSVDGNQNEKTSDEIKAHAIQATATQQQRSAPELEKITTPGAPKSTSFAVPNARTDSHQSVSEAKSASLAKLKDFKNFKQHQNSSLVSVGQSGANNNVDKITPTQAATATPVAVDAALAQQSDKPAAASVPKPSKKTIEIQCDGPDWTPVTIGANFKNRLLKALNKKSDARAKQTKHGCASSSTSSSAKNDKVRRDKDRRDKKKKSRRDAEMTEVDDKKGTSLEATDAKRLKTTHNEKDVGSGSVEVKSVEKNDKISSSSSGPGKSAKRPRTHHHQKAVSNEQERRDKKKKSRRADRTDVDKSSASHKNSKRQKTHNNNQKDGSVNVSEKKKKEQPTEQESNTQVVDSATTATTEVIVAFKKDKCSNKSSKRNKMKPASTSAAVTVDNDAAPAPQAKKASSSARRRVRSGLDMIRHPQRKKKGNASNPSRPNQTAARDCGTVDATETQSQTSSSGHGAANGQAAGNGGGGSRDKRVMVNKALGETLLHRAARQGYQDVLLDCLENNTCDINGKDNAGYTPLHECCTRGHLEIARTLLQYGANVNLAGPGGIRPLHDAVENDHLEVARLLFAYAADPTIATYAGLTPMKLARSNKMTAFLKGLLMDITGEEPVDEKPADSANPPSKVHAQRSKANPWKFTSVTTIKQRQCIGYDVLSGCPSDGDEDGDDFLFEVSERSHLDAYVVRGTTQTTLKPCVSASTSHRSRISSSGSSDDCLWLKLRDVLCQTNLTRERFMATHGSSTSILSLTRTECSGRVRRADSCRSKVIDFCDADLDASAKLELVRLDEYVRELLDIECFRLS